MDRGELSDSQILIYTYQVSRLRRESHVSPCSLKLSRLAVLISHLSSSAHYINPAFVNTMYNECLVNILQPVKQLSILAFLTNSDSRSYSD